MKRVRRVLIAAVLVVGFFSTTAMSCGRRGTTDAPIDQKLQDNSAPYIVNEPDQYMNLALKCAGLDLLVAHTRDAAPTVVPNASLCAPGVAEQAGIPRVAGIVPSHG